jgi:hypothetical protein
MAEKEKQSEHKSTIDKYFENTSKGFDEWVEENEEERSYLQIAAECTGDKDEEGKPGYDFIVSYAGKTKFLADGLYQDMKDDKFLRSIVITAAKKFLMDK